MRNTATPAAIDRLYLPNRMLQDLARSPKVSLKTLRKAVKLAIIAGRTA